MLLLLTGSIQTGKTRWLLNQLEALEASGVEVCGVVAPGDWVPVSVSERCPNGFDKLGIEALFYPQHTRALMAKRFDLCDDPAFGNPLVGEKMGWHFNDEVIATVNDHFAQLAASPAAPGLLVIDEVGRMELKGLGFTQAMALLDGGPTERFPHMLAIVRDLLLDQAVERFAPVWGDQLRVVHADDEGAALLQSLFV